MMQGVPSFSSAGWLTVGGLFAVCALAVFSARWLAPEMAILTELAEAWLPSGIAGVLCYVGLSGVLMCCFIPRQAISFVGGYLFGVGPGLLFSTLGVTLGCLLAFWAARILGRPFWERRLGTRLHRFNGFVCRDPFMVALVLRLFPSGSNLLFSLFGGMSRMRALPFILGSALGYIPQNLVFALLGSGIKVDPAVRLWVSGLLFLCSSLLGFWLYRRFQRQDLLPTPPRD